MKKTSRKYIADPNEIVPSQFNLFSSVKSFNPFPRISNSYTDFEKVLNTTKIAGIDFEFHSLSKPTIVAVSSEDLTVGCEWSEYLGQKCLEYIARGGKFVAHSGLGADKPVLEAALNAKTPLNAWEDSMVVHYLANQALTKTTFKEVSDDAGALGYMGLYTAASLVTDLPQWKVCRGLGCLQDALPCPTHRPIEYCAIDSWAGLIIYLKQFEKLSKFGVSYNFYRSKMELGEVCWEMQNTGVRIDENYVAQFDLASEVKKELLFEFDLKPKTQKALKELERHGVPSTLTPEEVREFADKYKDDWHLDEDDFVRSYRYFNPRSPVEIGKYFGEFISLPSSDKKAVNKALDKVVKQLGYETASDIEADEEAPQWVKNLYFLWLLKNEGKGIKAWFGPQYVKNGVIHPRWLFTGTSFGRLSSSGPNFTNIPARGFGAELRKAVIPHHDGYELYKADKAQLELRKIFQCAGADQKLLGADAFMSLVEKSGEDFFKAAEMYAPDKYKEDKKKAARNIAKVFSHSNSYLVGIKVIPYNEIDSPRIKGQIEAGLLRVYRKKYVPWLARDWEYAGGIVAFTGKQLAESAYGAATQENVRKALVMQEDVYFKNFNFIRKWQMKVTEFIETHGYIQHSCGTFLELYDTTPENRAKIAAGFIGQGESAHYMQELMLNYKELGICPLMQVHDELVFEVEPGKSDEEVKEFFRPMRTPSKIFDGFSAPIEIKRGPNWKDLRLVGTI